MSFPTASDLLPLRAVGAFKPFSRRIGTGIGMSSTRNCGMNWSFFFIKISRKSQLGRWWGMHGNAWLKKGQQPVRTFFPTPNRNQIRMNLIRFYDLDTPFPLMALLTYLNVKWISIKGSDNYDLKYKLEICNQIPTQHNTKEKKSTNMFPLKRLFCLIQFHKDSIIKFTDNLIGLGSFHISDDPFESYNNNIVASLSTTEIKSYHNSDNENQTQHTNSNDILVLLGLQKPKGGSDEPETVLHRYSTWNSTA